MGLVGSCSENCNCFGGNDVAKPINNSTYDSTSSDSDSMSDNNNEREPFKKGKKKKSKKKGKKRKSKRDLSRDESYISESDEEEKRLNKEKEKKKKKKKRNKDKKNKDKKSKDDPNKDVDNDDNDNNNDANNNNLYLMDTKTMELLSKIEPMPMGQQRIEAQQPQEAPAPKMETILSQPMGSIGFNDNNPMTINNINLNSGNVIKENVVTPSPSSGGNDMHAQLTNYTSNMMYGQSATNTPSHIDQQSEANYDALTVEDEDHNDITPALPQTTDNDGNNDGNNDKDNNNNNNNNNNELTVKQKKLLGGLDYDFEKEEPLNPLKTDLENVTTDRIMRTFETSQGGDDFEEIVKRTYTHNDDEEEETHDEDEDDDDDESDSMSEDEKKEIERRKTEELNARQKKKEIKKQTVSKSKLFRPGTTTPWDNEAMNDTMQAMNEQYNSMLRQHSPEKDNNPAGANLSPDIIITEDELTTTDDDGDGGIAKLRFSQTEKPKIKGDNKRQSALLRHKSAYKWDKEDLDKQNQEMQDQLVHLMKTHQGSIETDPTKQTNIMQPMH